MKMLMIVLFVFLATACKSSYPTGVPAEEQDKLVLMVMDLQHGKGDRAAVEERLHQELSFYSPRANPNMLPRGVCVAAEYLGLDYGQLQLPKDSTPVEAKKWCKSFKLPD